MTGKEKGMGWREKQEKPSLIGPYWYFFFSSSSPGLKEAAINSHIFQFILT